MTNRFVHIAALITLTAGLAHAEFKATPKKLDRKTINAIYASENRQMIALAANTSGQELLNDSNRREDLIKAHKGYEAALEVKLAEAKAKCTKKVVDFESDFGDHLIGGSTMPSRKEYEIEDHSKPECLALYEEIAKLKVRTSRVASEILNIDMKTLKVNAVRLVDKAGRAEKYDHLSEAEKADADRQSVELSKEISRIESYAKHAGIELSYTQRIQMELVREKINSVSTAKYVSKNSNKQP